MSFLTKERPLIGLRIVRGSTFSPLPELLGIAKERLAEIENMVDCEVASPLSVAKMISQTFSDANEYTYAVFYWGKKSVPIKTWDEREVGDTDDALDLQGDASI